MSIRQKLNLCGIFGCLSENKSLDIDVNLLEVMIDNPYYVSVCLIHKDENQYYPQLEEISLTPKAEKIFTQWKNDGGTENIKKYEESTELDPLYRRFIDVLSQSDSGETGDLSCDRISGFFDKFILLLEKCPNKDKFQNYFEENWNDILTKEKDDAITL